jgi:predicted DsbA family dithiol-disulfide isomerase
MPGAGGRDKEHEPPVAHGHAPGDIVRARTGVPVQEKRLIVVADYVCPYCFLAEAGAARLRDHGGVRVEGAAFELRPAGATLPDIDAEWLRNAWSSSVEPLAARLGVMLKRPVMMTRTRKAHEAAAYARVENMYAAMHSAIYRAYWQHGRDIGRIDVLVEIGREIGLDASRLRVALDIDQCTARVERDEAWAAQLRLAAVPAYVLTAGAGAGTGVAADIRVGLQRYEELRAWVERDNDI